MFSVLSLQERENRGETEAAAGSGDWTSNLGPPLPSSCLKHWEMLPVLMRTLCKHHSDFCRKMGYGAGNRGPGD